MSTRLRILGAVAAGGVLGALARYLLSTAWPHPETGFAWSTFTINVVGCFLMGILAAHLSRRTRHPLVRLFYGVGVLGGFTTFSTYVVDVQQADPAVALLYMAATPAAAFAAVWAGLRLASR